ncbi:YceI family protein [Mesorhizobium sp. YR577]|jgi:polyisoprenoid-binding protein YceI|uniref:YceI family protein n=1 Tax=Mesorhizobium sp. YR577 TaxID=1884373 RepID=UPI0008ED1E50|nr:YceI family protein [Mesorhizobium sp. YR577]SFU21964.1 Polyisoprenoid-binding protein YceI [Mesorhizobium sp. YR577]
MKFLSLTTALIGLAMTGSVFAADSYDIDPTHAWVGFKTDHASWAKAHGAFKTVSGSILFDKEDVTKSTVEITIEAASIDTNDEKRNTHLKSPDFLNAEEFPQITFKSTAIEKTGDQTAKVTGDLTLLGTTKPVILDVVWNGESPLPWDANTIKTGFFATGSFSGPAFGIVKMPDFGLGPDIVLDIDVEAVKK